MMRRHGIKVQRYDDSVLNAVASSVTMVLWVLKKRESIWKQDLLFRANNHTPCDQLPRYIGVRKI